MDKNLKAELSALRNDVLTNLEKIEQLLENFTERQVFYIDTGNKTPEEAQEFVKNYLFELESDVVDKTITEGTLTIKTLKQNIKDGKKIDSSTVSDLNKNRAEVYAKQEERKKQELINDAPEWAKYSDLKPFDQLMKQASIWDEDTHNLFTSMWNGSRKKRIGILRSVIDDTYNDLKQVQPQRGHNVSSIKEAQAVLIEYTDIENVREKVLDILQSYERPTLDGIEEFNDVDNFMNYYKWVNSLIDKIGEQSTQYSKSLVERCLATFKTLLEMKELEMYDQLVVDPTTFDIKPMTMPDHVRTLIRTKGHKDYVRDLQNAYEFLAKQEKEVKDTYSSLAINEDFFVPTDRTDSNVSIDDVAKEGMRFEPHYGKREL